MSRALSLVSITPVVSFFTFDEGYEIDKELGEIEDGDFVYKPMASNPKDAGEYFIIWSYAGDNNAYDGAHSDPLIDKITIFYFA